MAVALLLTTACAPHVQSALAVPLGFEGSRIVENAHAATIGHFVVQDGAELPYRRWSPEGKPEAVIVALHGFNDSSASWRLAGPWWAQQGIEVWAYDQRGFGGAPGKGIWTDPELSREDLRTVTAMIRARNPDAVIAIMGESMGGALGISAFSSSRPPDADRLIMLAPAVWGWSSQSPINRAALWAAARALGDVAVEAPAFAVREIMASDNSLELIRNARDPRFTVRTRFGSLHGLVDLMEQGSVGLADVNVPSLLAYGAHDKIVPRNAMRLALERSSQNQHLTTAYYPDGWHILNRDLSAERLYADVAAWLKNQPMPSQPQDVATAILGDD